MESDFVRGRFFCCNYFIKCVVFITFVRKYKLIIWDSFHFSKKIMQSKSKKC
jgi:hypothetical protein